MPFGQWRVVASRASAVRLVGVVRGAKCRVAPSFQCMQFHVSTFYRNNEDDILDKAAQLTRAPVDQPDQASDLIQSIDSHRPKKSTLVLANKKYEQIVEALDGSYTVPQLRQYLKTHKKTVPKKYRKEHIIQAIIHDLWGLSSQEMVKQKALKRKNSGIQQYYKTNRRELFFIIGDNGDTLRTIEDNNHVSITVLIDTNQFIVEGIPRDVEAARQQIKKYLHFSEALLDFPELKPGVTADELIATTTPVLPDISKETRTFITFMDNKFALSALSTEDLDYAKRLLSQMLTELNITAVKSLQASDETYLRYRRNEYIDYLLFLPVHDSAAMPITAKKHGWSRLSESRIEDDYNNTTYLHLTSPTEDTVVQLQDIKNALTPEPIPGLETNVLLEGRFGNLLFQNPRAGGAPFLQPPMESAFSTPQLKKLMNDSSYRRFFFELHPPPFISKPYLPVINGKTLHRRAVTLEYVNKNMMINFGATPFSHNSTNPGAALQRLEVQYLIGEDGSLSLERVAGEYGRRVVDVIGWKRDIDLRLLAKQSIFFANDTNHVPEQLVQKPMPSAIGAVLGQCKLTGYSDFYCPPSLDMGAMGALALSEVSFKDEARYLDEENGCIISISDVDTQHSQTRHTILSATPVDSDPQASPSWSIPSNGFQLWSSFTNVLGKIGGRWHYE